MALISGKYRKNGAQGTVLKWDKEGTKGMLVVPLFPVWALHLATWVNCLPNVEEQKLWLTTCLRGTAAEVMGNIVCHSGLNKMDYPLDIPKKQG